MPWQDISTAPKDGTRILACESDTVFICSWYRHSATLGHWHNPDDGSPIGQMFDEYNPTHWMPVPSPPA